MSRDCNLPYERRSALTCFAFVPSPSHLCWYWPQCPSPVAAKDQRLKCHCSASFAIRKSSSRAMAPRTGAPLPSCFISCHIPSCQKNPCSISRFPRHSIFLSLACARTSSRAPGVMRIDAILECQLYLPASAQERTRYLEHVHVERSLFTGQHGKADASDLSSFEGGR